MRSVLFLLAVLAAAPERSDPPADISGAGSPLLPSLCVAWSGEGAQGAAAPFLRCSGLVSTDVYLSGPEAARSVALGAPPVFYPAPPGPSALGRSVNWRILGDRPLAGILRYRFPAEPGEPEVFAVVKVAAPRRPGCLLAVVEERGDPDAPALAARIADQRAAGFRCGIDRPAMEGRPSDFGRRVLLPWLASMTP